MRAAHAASALGSSVPSAALLGVAPNPSSPPRPRGLPAPAGDRLIALFVRTLIEGSKLRNRRTKPRARLGSGRALWRSRRANDRRDSTSDRASASPMSGRQRTIQTGPLGHKGTRSQRGRDRRRDVNDQSPKTDPWSDWRRRREPWAFDVAGCGDRNCRQCVTGVDGGGL